MNKTPNDLKLMSHSDSHQKGNHASTSFKPSMKSMAKSLAIMVMGVIPLIVAPTSKAQETNAHENKVHENQTSERNYIAVADLPASIRNKTEIAISNYPLLLISNAVTKGAPSGKLLLDAGDIGHHGSLSPSDIKTVKDSRYVVWFGKDLETNLAEPLSKSNHAISLYDLNAFKRYPLRDVKAKPIEGTLDPHIWLDPENAKAISRALGALYSRANPEYKDTYAANVRDFQKRMNAAVALINKQKIRNQPYWAYHDAFQYIEPILNLSLVGTLTPDHHLPPKASQFYWLKKNRPAQTMCMVLQSDSNQAALSKLSPINSTVLQEDMSNADDFVSGWLKIAQDINSCVRG